MVIAQRVASGTQTCKPAHHPKDANSYGKAYEWLYAHVAGKVSTAFVLYGS